MSVADNGLRADELAQQQVVNKAIPIIQEETKEPMKRTDDVKDLDLSLNEKATVHQKFAEAEVQTDPEPFLEI